MPETQGPSTARRAGPVATGTAGDAAAGAADGPAAGDPRRKPAWLKVAVPPARAFRATARVLGDLGLHTVCSEARCPNKGECFAAGTATFLILGDRCTRECRFCSVRHGDPAGVLDADEPRRAAEAAARLGLRHVVVTSVTRDDLPDGGAAQFAAVVREVRRALPRASVELLTPDFGGDEAALRTALAAGPDVFNHNLETVPRLYADIRPGADYRRSLELLRRTVEWTVADGRREGASVRDDRCPRADVAGRPPDAGNGAAGSGPVVKTGVMLGLGEARREVETVLGDARSVGVDVVTMGQYLRPASGCVPVTRYVPPSEFAEWTVFGETLGLTVVAGPFVRSSYRAGEALGLVAGPAAASGHP